jgi:hypothetical protein
MSTRKAGISAHKPIDAWLSNLTELKTVLPAHFCIEGISWNSSHHVGWVDVFYGRFDTFTLKVTVKLAFYNKTDVLFDRHTIPFSTYNFKMVVSQWFATTFAEHDKAAFLLLKPFLDESQKSLLAIQIKGKLRDETCLSIPRRYAGLYGQEARLLAHDLDDT